MADHILKFWSLVDKSGSCWTWQWTRDQQGYGRFWHDGRSRIAHRFSYTLIKGPIPEGLEIDHLCRNRACVNPDHLEAVTGAENMRRAAAARTHCGNGHKWTEENTTYNKRGSRLCRMCRRQYDLKQRRRRQKQRALAREGNA